LTSWDTTWTLHVWGFHEAKLDSEAVKRKATHIKKLIIELEKTIKR
jgi:hypothetical protein